MPITTIDPDTGEVRLAVAVPDAVMEWRRLEELVSDAEKILKGEREEWEAERADRLAMVKAWKADMDAIKGAVRDDAVQTWRDGGPKTFGGLRLIVPKTITIDDEATALQQLIGVEFNKQPLVKLVFDMKALQAWAERNPAMAESFGIRVVPNPERAYIQRLSEKQLEQLANH